MPDLRIELFYSSSTGLLRDGGPVTRLQRRIAKGHGSAPVQSKQYVVNNRSNDRAMSAFCVKLFVAGAPHLLLDEIAQHKNLVSRPDKSAKGTPLRFSQVFPV